MDGEFKKIVEDTRRRLKASAQQPADEEVSQVDSGIRSLTMDSDTTRMPAPNRFLAPLDRRLAPLHSPADSSLSYPPGDFNQISLKIRQPDAQGGLLSRPQLQQQPIQGLTLSGTGSMFLKSNARRNASEGGAQDERTYVAGDSSASMSLSVKGILRDSSLTEVRGKAVMAEHRLSEPDADDRKSVRFNLEQLDKFSAKESSEESSCTDSSPNEDEKDINLDKAGVDWETPIAKDAVQDVRLQPTSNKPPIPSKASLRTQLSLDEYRKPAPHSLNLLGRTASTDTANDQRSTLTTFFDRKVEKNLMPIKPLYEDTDSESQLASPTAAVGGPFRRGTVAANRHLFDTKYVEARDEQQPERDSQKRPMTVRSERFVQVHDNFQSDALSQSNTQRTAADREKLDEALRTHELEFQMKIDEAVQKQQLELSSKLQHQLQIEETRFQQKFDNDRQQFEAQHQHKVEQLTARLRLQCDEFRADLESKHNLEVSNFEQQLKREFEEKQKEISLKHRAAVDTLQKNHSEIFEDLERDLKTEADLLRKEHANNLAQVKVKLEHELEVEKLRMRESGDSHQFEKLRCEKRLLEDKYRCLKEKYIRLKTEVKQRLERQGQQRRHTPNNTVTASETDRSAPHKLTAEQTEHKRSLSVSVPPPTEHGKPPASPSAPRHHVTSSARDKSPNKESSSSKASAAAAKDKKYGTTAKFITHLTHHQPDDTTSISQSDTTVSNNYSRVKYLPLQPPLSDNGNSDSEAFRRNQENNNTHSRDARKKLFTRMKSASTSRLNSSNRAADHQPPRPCSPMESLRRQLQKLEDLEDQFPESTTLDTTYHLRYPFKDITLTKESSAAPATSSELEFFKHRIHMERDSVRRAKDSLRTQRTSFRMRQREIKLRHKSSSRQSLDHLIHEAKDLTDMEVSLHRTKALLGEKVIRLRHLEQSLQRVYEKEKPVAIEATTLETSHKHKLLAVVHKDDATVSDLSSHSSSGFSSTDYATETNQHMAPAAGRGGGEIVGESSMDIIQSLEYLNSEIREIWEILSKQQRTHGTLTFNFSSKNSGSPQILYILCI